LVCVEGAPLCLRDCRLRSDGGPPVALRNGGGLDLEGCQVTAGAVALSVEVGQGAACRVRLRGNTFRVREASGAALSLWAAEVGHAGGGARARGRLPRPGDPACAYGRPRG